MIIEKKERKRRTLQEEIAKWILEKAKRVAITIEIVTNVNMKQKKKLWMKR